MKVIGYDTKKPHTTDIVKSVLLPYNGQLLSTEDFLANGLPAADLIIISGILRGTGLVRPRIALGTASARARLATTVSTRPGAGNALSPVNLR